MKKVVFVVFVVLVSAVQPLAAQARRGAAELFAGLNLTPEQKTELKGLRGIRDEIRDLSDKAKQERQALFAMLKGHEAADEKVRQKLSTVLATSKQIMEHRVDAMLKFRKILTPEQYGIFTNRLAERLKKRAAVLDEE